MIPLSHLDPSLDRLAKKIKKEPKDWTLYTVKQAEEMFKSRIFNENKTTSGSSFGRYKTKAWIKKRKEAGRQTSKKDLQMTGDFRRAIKPVRKTDNRMTLEFAGDDVLLKIADGQEKQIKKGPIFEFSEAERKELMDRVIKEIRIDINKMVKESFK